MPSEAHFGVEPVFEGAGTQFVPAVRGGMGERRVEDVGQRVPLPQHERAAERTGRFGVVARGQLTTSTRDEDFEPVGVDVRLDPVTTGRGIDRPAGSPKRFAEPRYQGLERVGRVRRRLVAPQSADQRFHRNRTPGVEREAGQEHAQADTADVDRRAVVPLCPDRAQQRYSHETSFPESAAAVPSRAD